MTGAEHRPVSAAWMERVGAEVVRGRHLIIHGNVRDMVRWRNRFVPLRQALTDVLGLSGYSVIGYYDQVDGMSSHPDEPERLARLLAVPEAADGAGPGDGAATPASRPHAAVGSPGERAGRARRQMSDALSHAAAPTYVEPPEVMNAIRRGLAQSAESLAFVVDFAELLLRDPAHVDRHERQLLALAKKAMLESAQVGHLRNLLILVVGDLANVPQWLYRDEPFIQPVEAMRPTFDERRAYLQEEADRFFTDPGADGASVATAVRALANLTEGLAVTDLDGLWRTSRHDQIALTQPRELVNRAMFGRRQDPWERLADRITEAESYLGARVFGQPMAVARVSRTLAAATLGIDFVADPHSLEARPKGVLFFSGPTGVGKTELARALSQFVYDDQTALARFDMSTFREEHAAERFTGAPPGYVGHERGGELTNRVRQRPFSLLLFDEIEKAHPAVLDKFLQILDDGRLTDGLGRTSYFSHTLIIFTSNLGAAEIHAQVRAGDLPSYEDVVGHFENAVREHFVQTLNRPELLGRIGNGIVAFDILRPENVDAIARKFLGQLLTTARRRGVELSVDEPSVLALVRQALADPDTAALGGRSVREALDRAVREPLVDWLATNGRTDWLLIRVPPGAATAEVVPARR